MNGNWFGASYVGQWWGWDFSSLENMPAPFVVPMSRGGHFPTARPIGKAKSRDDKDLMDILCAMGGLL